MFYYVGLGFYFYLGTYSEGRYFEKCIIENIQSFELQEMLNEMSESGKNRTAKKIYQLLSPLFEYAVADGIITLNPMAKVRLARYEVEHGTPLTKEEEKYLFTPRLLIKKLNKRILEKYS